MGVVVFGLIFWDRLVDADGKPDWVVRIVAFVVGLPLVVGPLVFAGPMALDSVARFKVLGFAVVVGFPLAGWNLGTFAVAFLPAIALTVVVTGRRS